MLPKTKWFTKISVTCDGFRIRPIDYQTKENLYLKLFGRGNASTHYTLVIAYAQLVASFPYLNAIAWQSFTLFAQKYVWKQIARFIYVLHQYDEFELIMKILCKILHRWKMIQSYFSVIDPICYIERCPKYTHQKKRNEKKVRRYLKQQLPPELTGLVCKYYSFEHLPKKPINFPKLVLHGLHSKSAYDAGFIICTIYSSLYFSKIKYRLVAHKVGAEMLQLNREKFGDFVFSSMSYYIFRALDYAYGYEQLTDKDLEMFADSIVEYLKENPEVTGVYQYPLTQDQQRVLVELVKLKFDERSRCEKIFNAWKDSY